MIQLEKYPAFRLTQNLERDCILVDCIVFSCFYTKGSKAGYVVHSKSLEYCRVRVQAGSMLSLSSFSRRDRYVQAFSFRCGVNFLRPLLYG